MTKFDKLTKEQEERVSFKKGINKNGVFSTAFQKGTFKNIIFLGNSVTYGNTFMVYNDNPENYFILFGEYEKNIGK